ncbi:MAG: hypothetical protein QOJ00_490, partial [Actinomycetota bacterium]
KPCLVINATGDPFTAANRAPEVADVFGGEIVSIESGHWWPLEKPDAGAKIINDFVASLG